MKKEYLEYIEKFGKLIKVFKDKNYQYNLIIQCENKHNWKTSLNNLLKNKKTSCLICRQNEQFKKYHQIIKSKNGKILKYEKNKITIQCNCCGNVWTSLKTNIAKNKFCKKCSLKNKKHYNKLNIETFQQIAKEKNGLCLSNIYENSHQNLTFQCEFGHVWDAKPTKIKNNKTWCPLCYKKNHHDFNSIKLIVEQKKGKMLSNQSDYVNINKSKLTVQCENGHTWKTVANNLKNHWCPICNYGTSNGENFIENWLINNNIKFEREKKFEECINPKLRFDFYLPQKNILIEFDGQQHFKPSFSSNKKIAHNKMTTLRQNDKIKNQFAKDKKIRLIRIKYDQNILNILEKEIFCN